MYSGELCERGRCNCSEASNCTFLRLGKAPLASRLHPAAKWARVADEAFTGSSRTRVSGTFNPHGVVKMPASMQGSARCLPAGHQQSVYRSVLEDTLNSDSTISNKRETRLETGVMIANIFRPYANHRPTAV
ncbi:unnamed protein product [Heligmosomoides polygyrus]|uniref:Uncharacterized protein n=1 Tax=Heligmosomoides polygyrus TaxID=6339 RepID=A0A183GPS1_HELPZ|nr:unnamed protein product [Heligmosomoides polygyrus]